MNIKAEFVRTIAAAQFLGVGKSTLEKLRMTSDGPRYSKLGRVVVYRLDDLNDWVAERVIRSTSEAPVAVHHQGQPRKIAARVSHHQG